MELRPEHLELVRSSVEFAQLDAELIVLEKRRGDLTGRRAELRERVIRLTRMIVGGKSDEDALAEAWQLITPELAKAQIAERSEA